MAYQANSKIDTNSYNDMIGRLKEVYGNDNLMVSYGQTTLASGDNLLPVDAIAGELVTADQWNKLYEMVERCGTHQRTPISVTLPRPILSGGVSDSDVVQFYSELDAAITDIRDNSFSVDPDQLVTTTDGNGQTAQTSTRSKSWSNSISYAVNATPNGAEPSDSAPGWFFNAGSEFIITLNYTGTNVDWTNLSNNYGTIKVDYTVFNYSNGSTRVKFFSETEGNDTYNVYYTLQTDTLLFEVELVNNESEVVTGSFEVFIDESRAVNANAVTVAKPTYSKVTGLSEGGTPILSIALTRVNTSVPECEFPGSSTSCDASFSANDWYAEIRGSVDGAVMSIDWEIDGSTKGTTSNIAGDDGEVIQIYSPAMTFTGNSVGQTHTMVSVLGDGAVEKTDSEAFIADHNESTFTAGNITETVVPPSCDLGVANPCSMSSTFTVTPSGGSGSYTYGWSHNGNVTGGVSTNSTYVVTSNNSDETTVFDVNVDVFDTSGNDGNVELTGIEHVRLLSPLTASDITETVVPTSCDLDVTNPCSMSSTFSVTASGGSGSYTYGWSHNGNVTGGVSTNSTYVVTSNNNDETTVFDVNVDVFDTFGADTNVALDGITHTRVSDTPLVISIDETSVGGCSIDAGPCTATSTYSAVVSGLLGDVSYQWGIINNNTPGTGITTNSGFKDITVQSSNENLGNETFTVTLEVTDSFNASRIAYVEYDAVHNRYETVDCTEYALTAGYDETNGGDIEYFGYSKPLTVVLGGSLTPNYMFGHEIAYIVDTNYYTDSQHFMVRVKSATDPGQDLFSYITITDTITPANTMTFNTDSDVTSYVYETFLNYAEWHFNDVASIALTRLYDIDVCTESSVLGPITVSKTNNPTCDIYVSNPCTTTPEFSVSEPSGAVGSVSYVWSAKHTGTGNSIPITGNGTTASMTFSHTNTTPYSYTVVCTASDSTSRESLGEASFTQSATDGASDYPAVLMPNSISISEVSGASSAGTSLYFMSDGTIYGPSPSGASNDRGNWIDTAGANFIDFDSSAYTLTIKNDSWANVPPGGNVLDNLGVLSANRDVTMTTTNLDSTTVRTLTAVVTQNGNSSNTDETNVTLTITPRELGGITISRQFGTIGTCDLNPGGTCVSSTTYEVNPPSGAVGTVNYLWSVTGDTDDNTTLLPQGDHCDVQMTHTSMTGDRTYTVSCSAEDTGTGLIVSDSFDSYQEVTDSSPVGGLVLPPVMWIEVTESGGGGSEVLIIFLPDGTISQDNGIIKDGPSGSEISPKAWISGSFDPADYTVSLTSDVLTRGTRITNTGAISQDRWVGVQENQSGQVGERLVTVQITGPAGTATSDVTLRARQI